MTDPHDASTVRWLLDWFLSTEDEADVRDGLDEVPPAVWPAFMTEAAAGLDQGTHPEMKRRWLGAERERREYPTSR